MTETAFCLYVKGQDGFARATRNGPVSVHTLENAAAVVGRVLNVTRTFPPEPPGLKTFRAPTPRGSLPIGRIQARAMQRLDWHIVWVVSTAMLAAALAFVIFDLN